jgi:hypothetical protein
MLNFADAVALGELDQEKAAEQKVMLLAALAQAKGSFARAVNGIHDMLDPAQRAELVDKLQQEQGPGHAEGEPKHGLAKVALAIGLTEAQQGRLAEEWSNGLDQLFPSRKVRREEWQAKMKAVGEAFLTDDFDAADYNFTDHAEEAVLASVEIASRGVDVTRRVLSGDQRKLTAEWIRDKAADL